MPTSNARTYAWLQSTVAGYMHRTDLASRIPDFVMLAEARINGDLEARLQSVTTTLAVSANVANLALPEDLNSIRSLSVPIYGDIEYMVPDLFRDRYAATRTGYPVNFTVVGNTLTLGPTPDASYTLTLVYRGNVPPLADSAGGSNWLIQSHADVYLAATMCEVLAYVRDNTNLPLWEGKYQNAITKLNKTDWNAASPMSVRSDVRNR